MTVWKPGDHISASQLFQWDRCSASYWFSRVMRIPAPDRSFFVIGGELHRIAEMQLLAKRDKRPLSTMSEVEERIQSDLSVIFAVPGIKFASGENAEICIEDSIGLARLWHKEIEPKIEPLAIELAVGEKEGLRLPGSGTPVKVVIDTIDHLAGIRDLKTGKSRWPEGVAEKKLQTVVYSWAYRVLYGCPPPYVAYDILIRKKRGKKRTTAEAEYQEVKVVPDPRLEFGVLRRMEAIVRAMKDEAYWPNYSSECSSCPFESTCLDFFTKMPFAPGHVQEAEDAPINRPKLIRVGRSAQRIIGALEPGQ